MFSAIFLDFLKNSLLYPVTYDIGKTAWESIQDMRNTDNWNTTDILLYRTLEEFCRQKAGNRVPEEKLLSACEFLCACWVKDGSFQVDMVKSVMDKMDINCTMDDARIWKKELDEEIRKDKYKELFEAQVMTQLENIRNEIKVLLESQQDQKQILKNTENIQEIGKAILDGKKKGTEISVIGERLSREERACLYRDMRICLKEEFDDNPSQRINQVDEGIFPSVARVEETYVKDIEGCLDGESKERRKLSDIIEDSWREDRPVHLLLEGEGGIGKTTILLNLEMILKDKELHMIYVPLRRIHSSRDNAIKDYICENVCKNDRERYHILELLWSNKGQDGPEILLLLDGLNEVTGGAKRPILKEIENLSRHKGLQIILASRYDERENLEGIQRLWKIALQPLSQGQIREFLEQYAVAAPEVGSELWSVINYPLMLILYAKNELVRDQIYKSPLVDWKENCSAGRIIWNYLQTEIGRLEMSHNEFLLEGVLCAEFIAPYIGYQMQRKNQFLITETELRESIEEALEEYQDQDRKWSHIKQVISYEERSQIKEEKLFNMMTVQMNLFRKNTGKYFQIMHQRFRDCFAAIYLIRLAEMTKNGCPGPWCSPMDEYVMSFIAELILPENKEEEAGRGIWYRLWDAARKGSAGNKLFIEQMLLLYRKVYGEKLNCVSFSGMDLSGISLNGFDLSGLSKGAFSKCSIAMDTFKGMGHGGSISGISRSPNMERFVSSSHDCTLRIWEEDQETVCLSGGHDHYIRCSQWSPVREDQIASGGDDQELLIWTQQAGKWIPKVVGKCEDWIHDLAWSFDGKAIACGDRSGIVKVFYPDNGSEFTFSKFHQSCIRHVAWKKEHPNIFATGGDDGRICIWKEGEKTPLKIIEDSSGPIVALCWMAESEMLVGADSRNIRFWHVQDLGGEDEQTLEVDLFHVVAGEEISQILTFFIEDKEYIAVFDLDTVKICTIQHKESGRYFCITSRKVPFYHASCAVWMEEKKEMILGTKSGAIFRIKLIFEEGNYGRMGIYKVSDSSAKAARCSAWSSDGRYLAVGYDDGMVRIWSVKEKRCSKVFPKIHSDSIKGIAWSPDDKILATGSDDKRIILWDVEKDRFYDTLWEHKGPVNCLLWFPDGTIVSGSDDGTVIFHKGKRQIIGKHHTDRVYALAASWERDVVFSTGNDRQICMWNISTGELLDRTESTHTTSVRGIALSPSGRYLVTGANDSLLIKRSVKWEDNKLGEILRPDMAGHKDFVYSVGISGNDKYIISGSSDSTLIFWDAETGKPLSVGKSHKDFIWNVSASPEISGNCYAASCSNDGTTKVWDVTEIFPSEEHVEFLDFPVIPNINLLGCDFSGAVFSHEGLKETIKLNGGIIED